MSYVTKNYGTDGGDKLVIGGTLECYADSTGKSIYVFYDDGQVVTSA